MWRCVHTCPIGRRAKYFASFTLDSHFLGGWERAFTLFEPESHTFEGSIHTPVHTFWRGRLRLSASSDNTFPVTFPVGSARCGPSPVRRRWRFLWELCERRTTAMGWQRILSCSDRWHGWAPGRLKSHSTHAQGRDSGPPVCLLQVAMTPYDSNTPGWDQHAFKADSAAFSPLAVKSYPKLRRTLIPQLRPMSLTVCGRDVWYITACHVSVL
jgi:hypothetical protein